MEEDFLHAGFFLPSLQTFYQFFLFPNSTLVSYELSPRQKPPLSLIQLMSLLLTIPNKLLHPPLCP